MSDVTQILGQIESGDPSAAEELLPVVYDELRRLATRKLSQQAPGQTLQATALVHEAYLRLVDSPDGRDWNSRGHFFTAAAEAMRRILVENARRKSSLKRGGHLQRVDLDVNELSLSDVPEHLLALDEALNRLAETDPDSARLVELRYFSGMTIGQAARALGVSPRSADRMWAYARVWLLREIRDNSG
jgi:RNA polymerase sigma factor (TIGR02999 family)